MWASAIAPRSLGAVADCCERRQVGFALRAGLGEATAVARDRSISVPRLTTLSICCSRRRAAPVPGGRRSIMSAAAAMVATAVRVVATKADEQPEQRLRAGDEAGIPRRRRQLHRLLHPHEGLIQIFVAARCGGEQPQPAPLGGITFLRVQQGEAPPRTAPPPSRARRHPRPAPPPAPATPPRARPPPAGSGTPPRPGPATGSAASASATCRCNRRRRSAGTFS